MSEPMVLLGARRLRPRRPHHALFAGLKGWQGWLDLKRLELAGQRQETTSPAMERIEMADLKERIRKLEAIACRPASRSEATKQSKEPQRPYWIASLRSQ
jgi:hypothetical protein